MQKIALMPFQNTAVGFYRILQPGRVMVREKIFKEARSLPFTGEHLGVPDYRDEVYMYIAKNADVIWSNIVYDPDLIIKFLNLRKLNKSKVIYDMDDNFYGVPIDNPSYEDIKPLKKNFESCLRSADGVTVSVPSLKKIYEQINPNVYVIKNGLDFKIWDKLETKHRKKVRIGWRGAHGHKDDLELIKGALEAITKDYNVELVTIGWQGFYMADERHPWVSTFEYPEKLASLDLDIGIIPLVDSAYNRCKSNLSYLEFSALKIPTVLSPIENQKGMVGLEASSNYEWYEALSTLIKNKVLREEMGRGAYKFVKKNYDIRNLVKPLGSWMEKLSRRKDLEP